MGLPTLIPDGPHPGSLSGLIFQVLSVTFYIVVPQSSICMIISSGFVSWIRQVSALITIFQDQNHPDNMLLGNFHIDDIRI